VHAGRCFLLTVGVLVLFTVARGLGWLGPPAVAAGLLTGVLALIAWSAGATLADLGLRRGDVGAGLHPEPVADGGGDAADDALDDAPARKQRRRERQACEDERAPAAGERDVQQLPGFRW